MRNDHRVGAWVVAGWVLALAVLPTAGRAGEESPETKAILKGFLTDIKSKKADDRLKAAEAIGELGPKAKAACRPLCEAMLDGNGKVRTAAADALAKIDKGIADLAIAIYVNRSLEAVEKAAAMGGAGEPLCPLIWTFASRINAGTTGPSDQAGRPNALVLCLGALSKIAPDDPSANAMVITAISLFQSRGLDAKACAEVRLSAAGLVRSMKNKKQALTPLLHAAAKDTEPIRVHAIASLVAICDPDNDKQIAKALEDMRFDVSVPVRQASEAAREAIKKK